VLHWGVLRVHHSLHFESTFWADAHFDDASYLFEQMQLASAGDYVAYFFVRLGNWFILFVNFVPISMMITLEMIRLFQAFFIINDRYMAVAAAKPTVQSSNLNDDLGQISHIFSDKTGTLTCNSMDFR
jgi:phospholipid-transporting ATPase